MFFTVGGRPATTECSARPLNRRRPAPQYIGYPDYYALQLASKIIVPGGQVVSANSNYGDLDVYAVMESDGDLSLLVVNTNPAAAITDQIGVADFSRPAPRRYGSMARPRTLPKASRQRVHRPQLRQHESDAQRHDVQLCFPAYSMTVLDLSHFCCEPLERWKHGSPALPAKTFRYAPRGTAWQFSTGAGVASNGQRFHLGQPQHSRRQRSASSKATAA